MSTEQTTENRRAQLRRNAAKMRRKLLIAAVVILAALILLIGIVLIADRLSQKDPVDPNQGNYKFYPTYEGDILFYEEYLALNRAIRYCNSPNGYGLHQEITEDTLEEFDNEVLFLYEYLQAVIAGDADAYNAFFHASYFKKQEPMSDFSQQMVYDATIYFEGEEEQKDGSRLCVYRLEYKIHQNDGSFRRDVGSDGIRPQSFTLEVLPNGSISILAMRTYYSN